MLDKVLKLLLLASPLAYMRGFPLNTFDVKFFHIGAIALSIAALSDHPIRTLPLGCRRLLIAFLGLCLLNIFMHRMDSVVMNRCVNMFLAVGVFVLIVLYCKKPEGCYKYIVLAGIMNIMVFLLQKVGFNPILNTTVLTEAGGVMGNSQRLMSYLAITLPFMLNASVFLLMLCVAVAIIGTEVSLLGIAVVILFLKNKLLRVRIGIGLLSGLGVFMLHERLIASVSARLGIWRDVLTGFFSAPLAGFGLGVYPWGQDKIRAGCDMVIWSSHLQFIVGAGILAVPLLYLAVRAYIRKFDTGVESLAVLSILLLSIVEYPLEITRLWFTIIAIGAFFVIKKGGVLCC